MRSSTRLLLFALALCLAGPGTAGSQSSSDSGPAAAPNGTAPLPASRTPQGTDSQPIGLADRGVRPAWAEAPAGSAAAAVATTAVYFTPQDENTSTTALFLYNTNAVPETVALHTYFTSGTPTIATTVPVPALGMTRICSDAVSTVSASWAGATLVNFTTFSAYGRLDLPAGVKADAYVAWDTTGTYDPLLSYDVCPVRMSYPSMNPSTVTFTPQDENTSTTVLFLYNTTTTAATVTLQTWYISGSLTISTAIPVPALSLVRVCGDAVSTISASWAGATIVNFTTFSAYARMSVPAGVLYDGYVAWNPTGSYDPMVATRTLPLDFASDANGTLDVPRTPAPALRSLRAMPNPALRGTRVGFALPDAEDVDLDVFDASGRVVQRLAHGRLSPGEHEFAWDGRTTGGSAAEAGVYFVRLVTPTRESSVKVVALH